MYTYDGLKFDFSYLFHYCMEENKEWYLVMSRQQSSKNTQTQINNINFVNRDKIATEKEAHQKYLDENPWADLSKPWSVCL